MNRFKGVRYPIEFSPFGLFHDCTDVNQIKSSLLVIILTLPGERPFELEFGTPLHVINLKQPIEMIESDARLMIARSIKKWEKRVQINDIKVKATPIQLNQFDLRIDIEFIDPLNISSIEKMSLETSIGEYIYCR